MGRHDHRTHSQRHATTYGTRKPDPDKLVAAQIRDNDEHHTRKQKNSGGVVQKVSRVLDWLAK